MPKAHPKELGYALDALLQARSGAVAAIMRSAPKTAQRRAAVRAFCEAITKVRTLGTITPEDLREHVEAVAVAADELAEAVAAAPKGACLNERTVATMNALDRRVRIVADAMHPEPTTPAEAIGRYAADIRGVIIMDTASAKVNTGAMACILGRPLTNAEIDNLPGRKEQRIGFYDSARSIAKRWGLVPPDPDVLESHTLRRLQAWAEAFAAPTADKDTKPTERTQLDRLRAAITTLGREAKPEAILREGKVADAAGRRLLRDLEGQGDYIGFARNAPSRYTS